VAKLPPPPTTLPPLRSADVRTLPAGTELWRIYFAGGDHSSLWDEFRTAGPLATSRFDHHLPSPAGGGIDRGILYSAERGPTCFAEVFQVTRTINRTRREPWLVSFATQGAVRLIDLAGVWPTRAGASQAINSGPRVRARAWSRTIYEQYPEIEGLSYPSSMLGRTTAIALYERAREAMPARPLFHAALTHPGLQAPIHRIARTLGYGLV
jgi:RES domain-containing protein